MIIFAYSYSCKWNFQIKSCSGLKCIALWLQSSWWRCVGNTLRALKDAMSEEAISESELDPSHSEEEEYLENEEEEEEEEVDTEDDEDENDGDDEDDSVGEGHLSSFGYSFQLKIVFST